MKKTTKQKKQKQPEAKLDLAKIVEHLEELHGFIRGIVIYAEDPMKWPLTQPEQAHFVRTQIGHAKYLESSDDYKTIQAYIDSLNQDRQ